MWNDHLSNLKKKACQFSRQSNKLFVDEIPHYIYNLPRVSQHLKRWTFNLLYFAIGLLYNWAVHAVLQQMPDMHQFPSNVAGMIVLFFLLMCSHAVFPKFTDNFVRIIDPYSSFALRSMNIMFVPAVVEIVNNPSTSGPEIGRMICVFIVGYVVGFLVCTVLVRILKAIIFGGCSFRRPRDIESQEKPTKSLRPALEEEEVNTDLYTTSIITMPPPLEHRTTSDSSSTTSTLTARSMMEGSSGNGLYANSITKANKVVKHGPLHSFAIWCMNESNFDDLVFFIIFCVCAFIYLPLPADNPAMPFFRLFLYFSMTILEYSVACRLPPKIRVIVHPIILTAALVMAGIGYFERCKGFDIRHGVNLYKTGISFVSLVTKSNVGWPGGGDILSAAMDVSIISLAFNVYKSRPASIREWIIVFTSIIPMAFLIMFVTPLFAHGIGASPEDSLVWCSRSVTTAIGIVIADVLGANQSVVTCIIVFTGIMGPLFGDALFRLARVKKDDYLTIGITMGCSSHGVGTAYLIGKNPKASGMSSLAFAIFGTIGVIVASVPALSETIRHLSGF